MVFTIEIIHVAWILEIRQSYIYFITPYIIGSFYKIFWSNRAVLGGEWWDKGFAIYRYGEEKISKFLSIYCLFFGGGGWVLLPKHLKYLEGCCRIPIYIFGGKKLKYIFFCNFSLIFTYFLWYLPLFLGRFQLP